MHSRMACLVTLLLVAPAPRTVNDSPEACERLALGLTPEVQFVERALSMFVRQPASAFTVATRRR